MLTYISQIPTYQLIIFSILFTAFVCQVVYWLYYSSISSYRSRHRVGSNEQLPSVSVVVILEHDNGYVENGLPLLLEQEHPEFEVVVVNDCGGADLDFELYKLSRAYPNLRYTTIKKDDKFNHSRKIPLTIGIKAAKYDNIVVADVTANPSNEKWLSYVSRGLAGADLVIGYTGFELQKGFANKMIRSIRLSSSIRYLRAAIASKPYRGIYNNIAYTKSLFFDNRGYTHLTMTIGEDDLYVQKVANRCATNVIINPRSTMRQESIGGLKWWWNEQRYRTYSYRYYPKAVKFRTFAELLSRSLLFTSVLAVVLLFTLGLITNYYVMGGAIFLLIVRQVILYISINKIAHRLGEIKIIWSYMIYDFVAPLYEVLLCISRRLSPPSTLWIQNSK